MGSDLIPSLHTWHNGQELIDEVKFVIFTRKGFEIEIGEQTTNIPKNYQHVKDEISTIGLVSSTEVRRRIKESRENAKREID